MLPPRIITPAIAALIAFVAVFYSVLPLPSDVSYFVASAGRILDGLSDHGEAVAIVSSWLERPSVSVLEAGEACWEILRGLLETAQVSGPLLMDAVLAALALENGATLATTDRDFARFPKLKLVNPAA